MANFTQTELQQTLPQGSPVFPSAHVSCLLRSDAIFECEWCALVGGKTGINQRPLNWSSSSFQALGRSCSRARRGKWTQRPALGTAEVIEAWGNGCSHQQRGIRFTGSPRLLGFFSFLLLLVIGLMKHLRKTTEEPLADINLSDLVFGLNSLGLRWP